MNTFSALGIFLLVGAALLAAGCAGSSVKALRFEETLNRVYAEQDGVQMTMDIYRPEGAGPFPAVLVLHGGGWNKRSGDMASVCRELARRGFVALNATYRLAPKHVFPKALVDARAALAWSRAHADELGLNVDRFYVWGYSAGGHLALLLGLDPAQKIKGIVAGGAPTDLTMFPDSSLIINFLGKQYVEDKALWAQASPINHIEKDSPPTFLYHGSWDWIVEPGQMTLLESRLKAEGVEVETHMIPVMGHVAVYFLSSEAVEKGIRFLEKH